ncbi:MAG: hypothetical protein ACRCXZ_06860 [Patescibacteria group bacterium]
MKTTRLSDKQQVVLDTLSDIINYHHNAFDGDINPEDVFQTFVKKYIYINESGAKGYVDLQGDPTKDFEKTLFFNHVCAWLKSKTDKSFLIDNQLAILFKVLSIPYNFNHFDPRIYNYVS